MVNTNALLASLSVLTLSHLGNTLAVPNAAVTAKSTASGSAAGATPVSEERIAELKLREAAVWTAASTCIRPPIGNDTFSCGACSAVPDTQIVKPFGDSDATLEGFVGYSPSNNLIIVAHEGTNTTSALSSAYNDRSNLVPWLYGPADAPLDILVHDGYQASFAQTKDLVLQTVKQQVDAHPGAVVLATGQLPQSVVVKGLPFASPRPGNAAMADYIDSLFGDDLWLVIRENDTVPLKPGREFGFQRPGNVIWYRATNETLSCTEQEDPACKPAFVNAGPAPLSNTDHCGPYYDITLCSGNCAVKPGEAAPKATTCSA